MTKILTKSYKRWQPGTAMTSDQDEFFAAVKAAPKRAEGEMYSGCGTVYVNAERMAQLEREGYFESPSQPFELAELPEDGLAKLGVELFEEIS